MAGHHKIKICAEDLLLNELLRVVPLPQKAVSGPGNDCAAVTGPKPGSLFLLKTDCIAEDVHFLRAHDPAKVGWKALCRPLSDIAASGGNPESALVTIFSPPDLDLAWWKDFYRGLGRAARRFGVVIAGGEMSRQKSGIAVSIALTGTVKARHLPTRSGGAPGDLIFVSGRLGGSLRGRHLNFIPRLAEGRWLVEKIHPSAMMDLSDGLGTDLPRLARASGTGFEVESKKIPKNRLCTLAQALCDGEDYELLFTIPPRKAANLETKWRSAFPHTPLTSIGKLTLDRSFPEKWPGGWDHFQDLGSS